MLTDPPLRDEFEVSVFGPGTGESTVVHLGDNRWIVIDSCINRQTREVVPLKYLESIGVDLEQVELVVATHAHDDHIGGLAELVEGCRRAEMVVPAAASAEEFLALYAADEVVSRIVRPAAYSEYRRAFQYIMSRSPRNELRLEHANSGRRIPLPGGSRASSGEGIEMLALSPSSNATVAATQVASRVLRTQDGDLKRVAPRDPNSLAAAFLIRVGEHSAVIGADLIVGPGHRCGWRNVMREGLVASGSVSLIKVPHHGSPNADYEPFWSSCIKSDAVAVIAPFRGSKRPIPQDDDLERVRGRVGATYTTADTALPKIGRREKNLAASFNGTAKSVRDIDGIPGHVRARRKLSGSSTNAWDISLAAPAKKR